MTTLSEIMDSAVIKKELPGFVSICQQIGTTQIRNMGTIGGNITCRYAWAELGAVLIALDAQMHFLDARGNETVLSCENFFQTGAKTDKILTAVSILKPRNTLLIYRRIPKTYPLDIPLLAVCLRAKEERGTIGDIRFSVNSGTTLAQRDALLERFLNHYFLSLPPADNKTKKSTVPSQMPATALNHLDGAIYDSTDDVYKRHVFRVVIKEVLEQLLKH